MTTLRPERPADGPMSYEDTGQFEVVVGQLNDPLNDPLPGRPPAVEEPPRPQPVQPQPLQQAAPQPPQPASPWFAGPAPQAPPRQPEPPQQARPPRQHARPAQPPVPPQPVQAQPIQQTVPQPTAPSQPVVPQQPAAPQQPVQQIAPQQQVSPPLAPQPQQPEPPRPQGRHSAVRPEPPAPAASTPLAETDATAQLPQVSLGRHSAVRPEPPAPAASAGPTPLAETDATAQLPQISLPEEPPAAAVADTPADPAPPVLGPPSVEGGRAARRKAAKGGHRARNRGVPAANASAAAATGEGTAPAQPLSRVEARRAAKAAKDSPAVVASRVVGELFITAGVLMLLFVAYQLWWTNVRAHAQANSASNKLEQQWKTDESDPNRAPGTFSPGQGFAIMYIPKLDVKAPIAQGVSKTKVLDHGMIGHYDGALNTAMPWDKTGNFAVAAHRNTHGEPFRYINKLVPGDKVVVETATTYYTYEITSSLASTPPTNISVLQPVPVGSGFTGPGRYLTLTTCTPEFTSTNRLIVWGKMIEERPRSKGKPDALVNG
ncbi:sortase A [Actinacidiphila guanduensis]|uniref:Sortase A n=2 Tax=Actinacidiphila guanduensis TaxID=310781 RepID=A0A1G9XHV3_9ACTN|nr:class E sortase [Actinacidiphila guanduensis]SDM96016.1 sortase A [Actinacidiphila guanduensis]